MVYPPAVIVVMGPAGSGKSLVGARLAAALDWPFYEGDAFHPPANVTRMAQGIALTDADRAPWLAALGAVIAGRVAAAAHAVVTCSALKRAYRAALVPPGASEDAVCFVYLRAEPAVLAARLAGRAGHFFAAALLESQLAVLETPDALGAGGEPAPVLTLDATQAPETLIGTIRSSLLV